MNTNEYFGFVPVSEDAANEYEEKREELASLVDRAMFAQKDLETLIGPRGGELMINNHRNHAALIAMVLSFKRFDVLHNILPWVYRAYHNHGFSYEYFPRALECWIEAMYKILAQQHAAEIEPLYRRVIELHEDSIARSKKASHPDRLSMVAERWRSAFLKYSNALLTGDINSCVEIAESNCKSRHDAIDFHLNVIQPALYWIGDLWERGEITVAVEHMATVISSRVMSGLTWMFRERTIRFGRATVLAVTGEQHELGAWMVADTLETEGWDVAFLGSNVPLRDLFVHLAAMRPHILALSVAMPYNVAHAKRIIDRLKKDDSFKYIKIIVGGLAFLSFPDLWKEIGSDAFAVNAKEAAESARKFLEAIRE